MQIQAMTVGAIQEQTYFYIDDKTKQAFIIDPGTEANRILQRIKDEGLKVEAILITHGHFDHIGAVEALKEELGCEVIAHTEAKEYLSNANHNLSSLMGIRIEFEADRYVTHGEVIDVPSSGLKLQVIHAPGHSKDGVAYYSEDEKIAFVGDILFNGAVGRSDHYGGNGAQLLQSIKANLFTLPEDVVVYPGHGPSTTIGHEIKTNPFFNMYE